MVHKFINVGLYWLYTLKLCKNAEIVPIYRFCKFWIIWLNSSDLPVSKLVTGHHQHFSTLLLLLFYNRNPCRNSALFKNVIIGLSHISDGEQV